MTKTELSPIAGSSSLPQWLHSAGLWFAILVVVGCLLPTDRAEAEPAGVVVDEIIARVNDEVITRYELQRAAIPFLMQRGMQPSELDKPDRRHEIYRQVLQDMVDRHLLVDKASDMNLSISDKQIEQWMRYTRSQRGLSQEQFRRAIEQYGISYEAYRELIRQNLLKFRLVKVKLGSQISVSDERVNEMYRQKFGDPKGAEMHRSVSHILITPQTKKQPDVKAARARAQKVLNRLEHGKSFEKLAKTYSDGPSAKRGGFLGTFAPGELNPAFENAIEGLEAGDHTGVVETQHGFHVIRVEKIVQKERTGVEKRKRQIRQQLRQQAIEDQLDNYVKTLREQAFVETMYEPRD